MYGYKMEEPQCRNYVINVCLHCVEQCLYVVNIDLCYLVNRIYVLCNLGKLCSVCLVTVLIM